MYKGIVVDGRGLRIVLIDSIAQIEDEDAEAVIVAGSHGGVSAAEYALRVPLRLACFNDAGVGKDDAGIAALALLEQAGVAALTVSHLSARIGDARDVWEHGVVSHVNAQARAIGFAAGQGLQTMLRGDRVEWIDA